MSTAVEIELKLQREREGRCALCGIDTHETIVLEGKCVRRGMTIEGEVHRGRCLFCNPFTKEVRAALTGATSQQQVEMTTHGALGIREKDGDSNDGNHDEDGDESLTSDIGMSSFSQASNSPGPPQNGKKSGSEKVAKSGTEAEPLTSQGSCPYQDPKKASDFLATSLKEKESPGTPQPDKEKPITERNKMGHSNQDTHPGNKESSSQKRKRMSVGSPESTDTKKTKAQTSPKDFVREVIAEAKAKPQNPKVQDKSIERLRTRVENEEDKRKWILAIVGDGGIELILEAMKNHRNKSAVQYEGCKMLAIVAWSGDDVKIAAKGGIAAVLKAMKSIASAKVAEAGIEALVNLSTKPHLRDQIIAEGGLEVVSASLRNKPRNGKLQAEGCNFFLNVSSCGDVNNAIKISRAGAIPLIITAMKNHPNHEGIIETACDALLNLSVSNELRRLIVEAGGIIVILDLIENEAEELQEAVLEVLKNLTTDYSAVQAEVARAGGVVKILSLMKEFPHNDGLLEKACCVLQNLASHSEGSDLLLRYKGVTQVIVAMKNNEKAAKLQEEACSFLCKLCNMPSVAEVLDNEEMEDALQQAKKAFPETCGGIVDELEKKISSTTSKKLCDT